MYLRSTTKPGVLEDDWTPRCSVTIAQHGNLGLQAARAMHLVLPLVSIGISDNALPSCIWAIYVQYSIQYAITTCHRERHLKVTFDDVIERQCTRHQAIRLCVSRRHLGIHRP